MSADRPTILQIIPELDTGGAELSTIEIAQAVVRAGGRALVLSEGGRLASRIAENGGEFIPFPAASKNPIRIAANIRAIAAIARDEHVDLIHARSRAPAWSALGAARRVNKPFVTTYHGAYRETNRIKRIYNGVMAKGDVVIANSQFTADMIQRRYGIENERIDVIYRGVDISAFDPERVEVARIEELRRSWGITGKRIVLHPARLSTWKGQSDVIAAAALLRTRFPDLVFVLAGDAQGRDGYREQLFQQIANAGLDSAVKLVGHVADMPAAFAAAEAAIVASREPEAFGRTAAEAQAMGCPIVATNIGAPPETVLAPPRVSPEARTGWLTPPSDPEALSQALAEILSADGAYRAALAYRARKNVVRRFSQSAMQSSTLAVYDRLLGSRLQSRFLAATPSKLRP